MANKDPALGHRERQIVEAVYRLGEGAVGDVLRDLPDPPSYSTVRAMLGSLVAKKVLRLRRDGKRYLYRPAIDAELARKSALKNVLTTFFAGRMSDAVAALLDVSGDELPDEELREIKRMVDKRRRQNRVGDSS